MADHSEESEIRSAVQFAVIQICAQEETHTKTKITPQAVRALSELTYLYATTSLRNDLDAFATHAGRKTIHEADVKLVARKNPDSLLDKLNQYADQNFTTTSAPKLAAAKPRKKETFFNLDKEVLLSSSDDDDLNNPPKKVPKKSLPPPSDSSLSSADENCFKLPARPEQKKKLSIHDDDSSSDSGIENSRPSTSRKAAGFQPSYSAGGSRIKSILDQLSQDSFEKDIDMDMQE
jgi:histone H3/H4